MPLVVPSPMLMSRSPRYWRAWLLKIHSLRTPIGVEAPWPLMGNASQACWSKLTVGDRGSPSALASCGRVWPAGTTPEAVSALCC
jgi:hypothetical protein